MAESRKFPASMSTIAPFLRDVDPSFVSELKIAAWRLETATPHLVPETLRWDLLQSYSRQKITMAALDRENGGAGQPALFEKEKAVLATRDILPALYGALLHRLIRPAPGAHDRPEFEPVERVVHFARVVGFGPIKVAGALGLMCHVVEAHGRNVVRELDAPDLERSVAIAFNPDVGLYRPLPPMAG